MNQTILFSPVGGTDPISNTNIHDGSMLHIARIYKPDKIVLYLSREMIKYHEFDDRYQYALRKLFELQGRDPAEIILIKKDELLNVQEFDFFYREFRDILSDLMKDMDDSDQLLINVSSGTPAMKSGLAVLQTMGEIPAKLIQVITPERRMNEHHHENYDIETLWQLNPDNEPDCENRCRIIECPSLLRMKKEEIIKKHVEAYDYEAAYSVAASLSSVQKDKAYQEYIAYLKMAKYRLSMDFERTEKQIEQTGFCCYPVNDKKKKQLVEYALVTDIKLKKKEYADFIRSITPLIVDLFIQILKKQCNIDIKNFTSTKSKDGGMRWDENKLQGSNVLTILENEFPGFLYKEKFVKSLQLLALIRNKCNDEALIELCENIRHVEETVRNMAAHQLVAIDDERIQSTTGFHSKRIMDMIRQLFSYTSINVTEAGWDSYNRMNTVILEKMKA